MVPSIHTHPVTHESTPSRGGGVGAYKAVTDIHPYDYWLSTVIMITIPTQTTAIKAVKGHDDTARRIYGALVTGDKGDKARADLHGPGPYRFLHQDAASCFHPCGDLLTTQRLRRLHPRCSCVGPPLPD